MINCVHVHAQCIINVNVLVHLDMVYNAHVHVYVYVLYMHVLIYKYKHSTVDHGCLWSSVVIEWMIVFYTECLFLELTMVYIN